MGGVELGGDDDAVHERSEHLHHLTELVQSEPHHQPQADVQADLLVLTVPAGPEDQQLKG